MRVHVSTIIHKKTVFNEYIGNDRIMYNIEKYYPGSRNQDYSISNLVLYIMSVIQISNKECIENYKTTVPINLKWLDYSPFIRKMIHLYQAYGL